MKLKTLLYRYYGAFVLKVAKDYDSWVEGGGDLVGHFLSYGTSGAYIARSYYLDDIEGKKAAIAAADALKEAAVLAFFVDKKGVLNIVAKERRNEQ